MDKHIVALVPLDTYEQDRVDAAVAEGIRLIGGWETLLTPDERILIKPNLLNRALPQRAVTTHPAVFEAVARDLLAHGCSHLSFGDSPGSTCTPAQAADACGIGAAAEKLGIPWADFTAGTTVDHPVGHTAHSFHLANGVVQADGLVNVCKMKTHALERITGAMKNLYGCVLGINKGAGHVAYPDSEVFADMLCDLHKVCKARVHIMDGVTAMEGNGPTSGTPVSMNVLLFSADPVALDSVFASLVHLDPAAVPTCVSGAKYGLGVMDPAQIDVVTPDGAITVQEAAARFGKPDFDVFRGAMKKSLVSKLVPLLPFLQDRPAVDAAKCVACGICENACPVPEKAVHSGHGKKARYDYHKCIRCFCCQEMCPAKAIYVHHNLMSKVVGMLPAKK